MVGVRHVSVPRTRAVLRRDSTLRRLRTHLEGPWSPSSASGPGQGWRVLVACGKSRRAVSLALFAALACHTAAKFSVPFGQVFPNGFLRLFGQKVAKEEPGVYGFYTVLNTETFWGRPPVDERVEPGAREILRRPNPMQFRPYQYEGFSSAQRAELNSHDLSMRVLETPLALASPDHWDGYPGPVTLSLLFPRNRMSLAEPLLTSGVPGRGDIIYVRYLDSGHVALGYDHWGASGSETPPLPVDFGRSHEIMLSSGSLLPPPESIPIPLAALNIETCAGSCWSRWMVSLSCSGRLTTPPRPRETPFFSAPM